MEEGTFHHSAVAELLRDRFVEARLHVDYKENEERELEMVQSRAQPIYVVVDPSTGEMHGGRYEGAALSDEDFIDWLNASWDSAPARISAPPPKGEEGDVDSGDPGAE